MMTFELEVMDDGEGDGSGRKGDEMMGHPPSSRSEFFLADKDQRQDKGIQETMYFYDQPQKP